MLIAALGEFLLLAFLSYVNSSQVIIQGDWHVSDSISYAGKDLMINGSIYLDEGGILDVSDGSLSTLCSYDREFNIFWRGGKLISRNVTVGGRYAGGMCFHADIYLYDGIWLSSDDTVRCSYGVSFSEVKVNPNPQPQPSPLL